MKSVLKIVKKIMNVFCWLFIIILVGIIVFSFLTRVNGSSPSVFGYSFYRVSSGSMVPVLKVGDVILDKEIKDPKSLKTGEIITFEGSKETAGVMVTHKIIKAPFADESGEWMIQTKGIANDTADSVMPLSRVKAQYICTVPFLTNVYAVFLSPWGLIIIIALLIFIFFDEIIAIVRLLTGNEKSAKDAKNIDDIISNIKNDEDGDGKN